MNNLMNICGVSCYEENYTTYLSLKDVAWGLGFARKTASGNEVICWEEVDRYLSEIGVSSYRHNDYIPENIFYRLAMKATSKTAEKFQALVADEIIPSIRRIRDCISDQLSDQLKNIQETIEMLQKENDALKAKVSSGDNNQRTLTSIRDTAKRLNMGQKAFIDFLIDFGYVYRKRNGQRMPTAKKSNGLLELKEVISPRSSWKGMQVFVTPKGREIFRILCQRLVENNQTAKSTVTYLHFPGEDGSVVNITAVAMAFQINRLQFFKELENMGIIVKTEKGYLPNSEYVEKGYLIQAEYHSPETGKVTYSAKITKEGFSYLTQKFGK